MDKEHKKLVTVCQLLLIAVKQGEIKMFPEKENTPDYLQKIENLVNEAKNKKQRKHYGYRKVHALMNDLFLEANQPYDGFYKHYESFEDYIKQNFPKPK